MKPLEKIVYVLIAIIIVAGAIIARVNEEWFRAHYVVEDGPLEWGTFVMFVLCGCLMIGRAFRLRKHRSALFVAVTAGAGLLFFFGAGEEISWGQRVFGIETPEWMNEHNKQGETNLHNLEFGEISINKLVFSKLLAVAMVLYLLVLPALASRIPKIEKLTEKFAIPLPTKNQIIAWILALGLPEVLVDSGKKGEVREVCAGLMLFVNLRFPRNSFLYEVEPEQQEKQ